MNRTDGNHFVGGRRIHLAAGLVAAVVLSVVLLLTVLKRRPGDSPYATSQPQQSTAQQSDDIPVLGNEWIVDDYATALEVAKETERPMLIDFTGYFCTNCRWMERNMFTKREVAEVMEKFVLVRLYTDGRDAIHKKNQKMLQDRFGTITIPYYAVVSSDDKVVAKFDGMTRKKEQFIEFLQQGLAEKGGAVALNAR